MIPIDGQSNLAERDGRQLAVDMLTEFEESELNSTSNLCIDCRTTRGAPQNTGSLRRCLEAYAGSNAAVQEGFLQILSDFIAVAVSGSVRDVNSYQEWIDELPEPSGYFDEPVQ